MTHSLFAGRLEERIRKIGASVSATEVGDLERYFDLLRRWNPRINLTSLPLLPDPPVETLDRLFLEPIVASSLIGTEPLTCLDLGSGGGSPALPLKILRPALVMTMVEARARKTAFLREAVRQLNLSDVFVLTERFEDLLPTHQNSADLVTLRAVRVDEELLELIHSLLEPRGRLLSFGDSQPLSGFAIFSQALLDGATIATLYRRA